MSDKDLILRAIVWGCSNANKNHEDLTPYFEAFCLVWSLL